MVIDLTGKHALITGGSKGIGRAIAEQMGKSGARITTVSRSEAPIIEGCDHTHLETDFSKPDESLAFLSEYIKSNPVDILINNTGGPSPGPITQASWDDFTNALQMHLKVSHGLVQLVSGHMKEQQFGRVINVISTSVKIPIAGLGVSNTTRGAMASWSKTLSLELGGYGITVNNILPGFIATGRLDSLIQSKSKSLKVSEEQVIGEMKSGIPAGRFGEPIEMANMAVFLASDQAAYINGTNIPIDGGRTGSL